MMALRASRYVIALLPRLACWLQLALLAAAVALLPAAVLRPVCLSAVCVADSATGCTSTDTPTDMAQVESGRACV